MTVINPDHLLDQAERLIASTGGAPRQADLRRAVSTAYYAVFHAIMTALADQFVGFGRRTTPEYALAYRRVDHGALRRLCEDLSKSTPPSKYREFLPAELTAFSADLRAYSTAVVELQERRHHADYNPLIAFKVSDARAIVASARDAITRFDRVGAGERLSFLSLLAFGR